jgi:hypothetical protein
MNKRPVLGSGKGRLNAACGPSKHLEQRTSNEDRHQQEERPEQQSEQ